jgi:two-component system, OmpR family, sensor histidine kinase ArlS
MKIRNKIMLLFTLLVTLIISILSVSVYYFSSLERSIVFNKRLKSRAIYSAQLYSLFGDSTNAILNRIDSSYGNGMLYDKGIAVIPFDENSAYRFGINHLNNLPINQKIFEAAISAGEVDYKMGERDVVALRHRVNRSEFIIVVAAYDLEGRQRLRELLNILLVNLVVGVGLAALAGYLFSKKLLAPISQMIYEVNQISSYNLSHRLKPGSSHDEMGALANTFNDLLIRLQNSFELQKRFISNASHELSTPLTSISSQLEVTLQRLRNISDYRNVLQSISEDVLQMRQLTRSLLEIAKADAQGNVELSEVRIDEILLKITSEIKQIDDRYLVELYFGEYPEDENDCVVFGNLELLHSALKNIIENGCKYSDDHTAVVSLSFSAHHVFVTVKNKGGFISEDEMTRIFQPFYRGNNSMKYRGFGLGLSLAQGITRLHKGQIKVESDTLTGTTFIVDVPAYKSLQMLN